MRGEHPTWGELVGSLVVLVGLALALGLLDGFVAYRAVRARTDAPHEEAL